MAIERGDIMVNRILLFSSLFGVLAAILIFYSNMGMIYDRKTGRVFGLAKENPEDKITIPTVFKVTFEKNKAAPLGFTFLLLAFSLQLIEAFN